MRAMSQIQYTHFANISALALLYIFNYRDKYTNLSIELEK